MRTPLALALWVGLAAQVPADTAAPATPRTPAEIRQEMTAIRQRTNWGNAAAAKEANARIAELAGELLQATKRPRPEESAGAHTDPTTLDPTAGGLDRAKLAQQMAVQMGEAAAAGEGGDMLLAKQVREQIVAEYTEALDPTIRNPEVFSVQMILVIDFSSPSASLAVAQMENFRGITTLVLTGGRQAANADLDAVLRKARAYPLQELYIIGFRDHLRALPSLAAEFSDLRLLAVFDNALSELPPALGKLRNLKTLYVDANPLATVLPAVRSLPGLTKLGVGRTDVGAAEIASIRLLLPNCEILTR